MPRVSLSRPRKNTGSCNTSRSFHPNPYTSFIPSGHLASPQTPPETQRPVLTWENAKNGVFQLWILDQHSFPCRFSLHFFHMSLLGYFLNNCVYGAPAIVAITEDCTSEPGVSYLPTSSSQSRGGHSRATRPSKCRVVRERSRPGSPAHAVSLAQIHSYKEAKNNVTCQVLECSPTGLCSANWSYKN